MERAIVILLACELTFIIWRDWDIKKFRQDLKDLEDSYNGSRRTLENNFVTAIREADHWREKYEALVTVRIQPTTMGEEKETNP